MVDDSARAYHVQLRHFPHNHAQFNLSARELGAIAERWVRGEWVELGERRWSPHVAQLTILEGARLPVGQLTMGRGWRNAERRSEDVTERVLAELRGAPSTAPAAAELRAAQQPAAPAPGVDSLALELLSLLEGGEASLGVAWRLARERTGPRSASESLTLAELAVRSLLHRGLITLVAIARAAEEGADESSAVADVEAVLRAPESWGTAQPGGESIVLRRT